MTKLCECGCGEPAPLAPYTNRNRGYVKGEPMRFVHGHHRRKGQSDYLVDASGCWVWQRGLTRTGYAIVKRRGFNEPAHRFYYEQAKGPIPRGLHLDHLCRNRACVNPSHLEPVTNAANAQRGDLARLDWEKVRYIRASSLSLHKLAVMFGVHWTTIQMARVGKTWRDEGRVGHEVAGAADD